MEEHHNAAQQIQRMLRGKLGRQSEILLKKKRNAQQRTELRTEVSYVGISRGRKGRNEVTTNRANKLAAIRKHAIQNSSEESSGAPRILRTSSVGVLSVTVGMIKEGLKCYGEHPLLLRHCFLQLELPVCYNICICLLLFDMYIFT